MNYDSDSDTTHDRKLAYKLGIASDVADPMQPSPCPGSRRQGLTIAFATMVCMSPDAAITRWARTTAGSSWQIVFFRMSMTCVLNLIVTSYLANEPLKLLKDLTRKAYPLGLLAIAAALVAGESIGYSTSSRS